MKKSRFYTTSALSLCHARKKRKMLAKCEAAKEDTQSLSNRPKEELRALLLLWRPRSTSSRKVGAAKKIPSSLQISIFLLECPTSNSYNWQLLSHEYSVVPTVVIEELLQLYRLEE